MPYLRRPVEPPFKPVKGVFVSSPLFQRLGFFHKKKQKFAKIN